MHIPLSTMWRHSYYGTDSKGIHNIPTKLPHKILSVGCILSIIFVTSTATQHYLLNGEIGKRNFHPTSSNKQGMPLRTMTSSDSRQPLRIFAGRNQRLTYKLAWKFVVSGMCTNKGE